MAVAVKKSAEPVVAGPMNRLAVASLLGVAYLLGSLGIVFYAIPNLWQQTITPALKDLSFVNYTLLVLAMLAAIYVLVRLGMQMLAANPPHGWKAGVALGFVGLLVITLLTVGVGSLVQSFGADQATFGVPIMLAVGAGLLFLLFRALFRSGAEKTLIQIEDQGWFTAAPYKKTQGQRVRRATMLAVLAIAVTGIWTLLEHKSLEFPNNHWELTIPFLGGTIPLLRDVRFTVPILLALGSFWLAYRLVNFPVFADFLIATEAELNKVSWATRKRLVQDTIVVLTTVVLVTAFIFFVDIFWGWGLRTVGVLQLPERGSKTAEESSW